MFLFKTSGATFASVIRNQKHAFKGKPTDWAARELVLVSKNQSDCRVGEKQIQYVMRLETIRPLRPGEAERYWPGNENRWNYLIECNGTKALHRPFNLAQVLGPDAEPYRPVMTFRRFEPTDERRVLAFIQQHDPDVLD